MKIRSLLLGSVAAAGLSTGAFAADLGVATSLDICDTLAISGLTISSEANCLSITGGVDYRLRVGDFAASTVIVTNYNDTVSDLTPDTGAVAVGEDEANVDYQTRTRAFLRAVGTANSDFGPASATIRLRSIDETRFRNEGLTTTGQGDDTGGTPIIDEAFVSIGDTTVLTAGKRLSGVGGSVANINDDDALHGFSFFDDSIDGGGIVIDGDDRRLGNSVIQATTDLGNGIGVRVGLENLDGYTGTGATQFGSGNNGAAAGTLVGVLDYKGENVTAHATGIAYGVLDGTVEAYAAHVGATGTFENFQVRAAVSYDSNYKPYTVFANNVVGNGLTAATDFSVLHGIVSGLATFDIFKIGATAQAARQDFDNGDSFTDYELSGSGSVTVTEGVTLNLLGTYFHDDSADLDTTRVQADAAFAVTETITLSAALGVDFGTGVEAGRLALSGEDDSAVTFGSIGAAWNPGGGLTSAARFEANDLGAYRTEITASKSFN